MVPEPDPVQRQDPVAVEFDMIGGVHGPSSRNWLAATSISHLPGELCTIATASRSKMLRSEPTVSDTPGGGEAAQRPAGRG